MIGSCGSQTMSASVPALRIVEQREDGDGGLCRETDRSSPRIHLRQAVCTSSCM